VAGHGFGHLQFQERIVAGERALALLPLRHQMLRGLAQHEIANRLRNLGQSEAASHRLMLALDATGPTEVVLQLRLRLSLAIGHYFAGSLAEAERYAIRVIKDAQAPNAVYTLCIAWCGIGAILMQQFEFERARHFLAFACDPERPGTLSVKILAAYALLRLLAEQGKLSDMVEVDRMILQMASAMAGMGFESHFAALSAYSRWANGEKASPRQWAFQESAVSLNSEFEVAPLVRARILLEEGSVAALAHAEAALRSHLAPQFATFPGFITLESRLLLAQIHWQRGDQAEALDMMEALVRDAYPRGFRRLFLDPAADGVSMLRALAAQGRCVLEAESLLCLVTTDAPGPLPGFRQLGSAQALPSADLLEPLTAREMEVLHLMNQGFDYRAIAERMVVSPHTVRNHISNIYTKLNVHSRIVALQTARSLGFLPAE